MNFNGKQIIIGVIVYIKSTTEFIKIIIEDSGIDNFTRMVRISLDGGQNFLKVIINLFDAKIHYSSEIYKNSCMRQSYNLAIVEMVLEDNGNIQKLLASLKHEVVNFNSAFDLHCASIHKQSNKKF